jgi:hypothetical protein
MDKYMLISSAEEEEDEALLRRLIPCEEDRQRRFPTTTWTGGYRWFKSTNVVCLEHYRRPRSIPAQSKAS